MKPFAYIEKDGKEFSVYSGHCGKFFLGADEKESVAEFLCRQANEAHRAALKEELKRFKKEAVDVCVSRSEMRDRSECDCRGYTRAAQHDADEIEAIDIDAFLDRENSNGKTA